MQPPSESRTALERKAWFVHPSPPPRPNEPRRLIAPYHDDFFRALDKLGFHTLFVGAESPDLGTIDPGIRRWTALRGRSLGPYKTGVSPAVVRYAARGTYDVWIASLLHWWPTHAAFPVVTARRKPFILWMEDWWWPDVRLGGATLRRYARTILRRADAVITCGTKAREFAVAGGAAAHKTFLALNATTNLGTRPWREQDVGEMRARLAPDADFLCLFLNRIVDYKGLDILLRAWKGVEARAPRAHLAIVGDGPEREPNEALAGALGLERVHFHPAAEYESVHLVYRAADLYVHAARFLTRARVKAEAWGMTLNEAMSVGTPVLSSTAVAAAHDLISDGETGFLVPPDDVAALADGLLAAEQDRERTAAIGARGRRRVTEAFLPEKKAETFAAAARYAVTRR